MNKNELALMEGVVVKIAKKAGKIILKHREKLHELGIISKDAQGIASVADLDSEKFIIKELTKLYKEIPILAEEMFFAESKNSKDYKKYEKVKYLWVIDPLDGTNNFVHGLDYFSVCISLLKNGRPVLGVVHAPLREETFVASKDNGTKFYLKRKKEIIFKKEGRKEFSDCLLSTSFIRTTRKTFKKDIDQFSQILSEVRAIRRMGSAALDLCYVSIGIYDAFWERGLAPWDMAAPYIICRESGVKVTKINGEKHSVFVADVLCARNPVHKTLLSRLSD